jgi:hypothetical protein
MALKTANLIVIPPEYIAYYSYLQYFCVIIYTRGTLWHVMIPVISVDDETNSDLENNSPVLTLKVVQNKNIITVENGLL